MFGSLNSASAISAAFFIESAAMPALPCADSGKIRPTRICPAPICAGCTGSAAGGGASPPRRSSAPPVQAAMNSDSVAASATPPNRRRVAPGVSVRVTNNPVPSSRDG